MEGVGSGRGWLGKGLAREGVGSGRGWLGKGLQHLGGVLVALDILLLAVFLALNLEPLRSQFGDATGLWSSCAKAIGSSTTVEAWSPWLLVTLAIPAAGSLLVGELPGGSIRMRRFLRASALVLIGVGSLAVLLPTATCLAAALN